MVVRRMSLVVATLAVLDDRGIFKLDSSNKDEPDVFLIHPPSSFSNNTVVRAKRVWRRERIKSRLDKPTQIRKWQASFRRRR